jgi:hypothetical protein
MREFTASARTVSPDFPGMAGSPAASRTREKIAKVEKKVAVALGVRVDLPRLETDGCVFATTGRV